MERELLELLTRLVGFDTHAGEAAQAAFLAGLTHAWGATTFIDEVRPGRVNFRAHFSGKDPGRTRVIEAHGDTVGGTVASRHDAAAGRFHGRGACDTKGAMAAMLLGIRAALARGPLPCDVLFASTCCEETGGEGAREGRATPSGAQQPAPVHLAGRPGARPSGPVPSRPSRSGQLRLVRMWARGWP